MDCKKCSLYWEIDDVYCPVHDDKMTCPFCEQVATAKLVDDDQRMSECGNCGCWRTNYR